MPAFATSPLDTIGSGDTYLSLLAINLVAGNNFHFANLTSALGSAFCVEQIGNKSIFELKKLEKYLGKILIK